MKWYGKDLDNKEPRFFSLLEENCGPVATQNAKRIFKWVLPFSETNPKFWGNGKVQGTFGFFKQKQETDYRIFTVDSNGYLEIFFKTLASFSCYATEDARKELLKETEIFGEKDHSRIHSSSLINLGNLQQQKIEELLSILKNMNIKLDSSTVILNNNNKTKNRKSDTVNDKTITKRKNSRKESKKPEIPTIYRKSWTDEIYGFAEFLYWEPQHISRQSNKNVQDKKKIPDEVFWEMRNKEVSLNHCCNLAMRLLPNRIKRGFVNSFLEDEKIEAVGKINFVTVLEDMGYDPDFTAPDMVLETENERVCVEMKIDAKLDLQQVYKYIYLMALWNMITGKNKKPYLLFLTKRKLARQWKPSERSQIFSDLQDDVVALSNYIKDTDKNKPDQKTLNKIENEKNKKPKIDLELLHDMANNMMKEITFGWSDWNTQKALLKQEQEKLTHGDLSDGEEALKNLIAGAIYELERRKL